MFFPVIVVKLFVYIIAVFGLNPVFHFAVIS